MKGSIPAQGTECEMTHRQFTLSLLAWILGIASLVGIGNLIIDPHGVHRLVDLPGLNIIKPRAAKSGEEFKLRSMELRPPETLILGNSRAEMGLDPSNLDPRRFGVTMNAALPGRNLGSMRTMADAAWKFSKPKTLLIGVDFMDCLERSGAEPVRESPSQIGSTWSLSPNGHGDFAIRLAAHLRDALSVDTAYDSLLTVAAQRNAGSSDLRVDGFNPGRDFAAAAKVDGPRKMFDQRDLESIRTRFAQPRSIRYRDGSLSSCFHDLNRLLDDARVRKQSVLLSTYPYHARILELIFQTGLWGEFEDWKSEIAKTAEKSLAMGLDISARDFSGYHAYAIERVPPGYATARELDWYWEAGHFKPTLGARMLAIMTGTAPVQDAFGVTLSSASLDNAHQSARRAREAFARDQPDVAAEIRRMLENKTSRSP